VLILIAVALMSCGVKGNPISSRIVLPFGITDLKAEYATSSVVLSWSMPEAIGDDVKFRISRSEGELAGEECRGCPRQFVLIAELYGRDEKIIRKSGRIVRYVDSTVKPGGLYAYRLVVCDSYENCSAESNQTELKIKE
jgi:hypothetical protein